MNNFLDIITLLLHSNLTSSFQSKIVQFLIISPIDAFINFANNSLINDKTIS